MRMPQGKVPVHETDLPTEGWQDPLQQPVRLLAWAALVSRRIPPAQQARSGNPDANHRRKPAGNRGPSPSFARARNTMAGSGSLRILAGVIHAADEAVFVQHEGAWAPGCPPRTRRHNAGRPGRPAGRHSAAWNPGPVPPPGPARPPGAASEMPTSAASWAAKSGLRAWNLANCAVIASSGAAGKNRSAAFRPRRPARDAVPS